MVPPTRHVWAWLLQSAVVCIFGCHAKLEVSTPAKSAKLLNPISSKETSSSPFPTSSVTATSTPTPYSLSLTSDAPLVYVASVNTSAYALSAGPFAVVNSFIAPAAPTSNAYSAPTLTDVTGALGSGTSPVSDTASVTVNTAGVIDATLPVVANITPSIRFPPDSTTASQGCHISGAFSAIVCALTSFSFSTAFTTADLIYNATSDSSIAPSFSASLPVKKLRVHFLSNTWVGGDDAQYVISGEQDNGYTLPDLSGKTFMTLKQAGANSKMYMSDRGSNLVQITDINPGANDNCKTDTTFKIGARMYFICGVVQNIFSSDGTDLKQMTNFAGGIKYSAGSTIVSYNSGVYFAAAAAANFKLYYFDGTTLTQTAETNAGGNDDPKPYAVINGRLYFSAKDSSNHYKLFSISGVTDLKQHSDSDPGSDDTPSRVFLFSNRIYFTAYDGANGHRKRLFSTDGASDLRRHTNTNPAGSDTALFDYGYYPPVVCGSKMYFWGYNASYFYKLYQIDNTGSVTQVMDLAGAGVNDGTMAAGGTTPPQCVNSILYFHAFDGTTNTVFKYDGTNLVKLLSGWTWQSNPIAAINYIFFSANDGTNDYVYSYNGSTLRKLGLGQIMNGSTRIYTMNGRAYFETYVGGWPSTFFYSSDGTDLLQVANVGTYVGWMFQAWNNISGGVIYFQAYDGSNYKLARICEDDGAACSN